MGRTLRDSYTRETRIKSLTDWGPNHVNGNDTRACMGGCNRRRKQQHAQRWPHQMESEGLQRCSGRIQSSLVSGSRCTMKCPNCRKKATLEHFRASPECAAAAASICALYRGSKRIAQTHAGGRPKIPRPCPVCGIERPSAREAWNHCRGAK